MKFNSFIKRVLTVVSTSFLALTAIFAFTTVKAEEVEFVEIGTAEELAAVMADSTTWTKNYKLTANIDLTGKEQSPIGVKDNYYTGTFDGNGYTVSGIDLTSDTKIVGFFGYTNGATIKNLTLEGSVKSTVASKSTESYASGFMGAAYLPLTISNCVNNVNVTSPGYGNAGFVGNLIGKADETALFENCVNNGTITSDGKYSGGFIGICSSLTTATSTYTFKNCVNNGTVTSLDLGTAGIVGYIGKFLATTVFTFDGCQNNASVTGTTYVGGVIGSLGLHGGDAGTLQTVYVDKCLNSGAVKATGSTGIAGGIVGLERVFTGTRNISNCINTGAVTGSKSGSMVGNNIKAGMAISNCFNSGVISSTKQIYGATVEGSTMTNCYYTAEAAIETEAATYVAKADLADRANFTGFEVSVFDFDANGPKFHEHVGGTATCEAKATCTACGAQYGEFGAHSLTKTEAKEATYEAAGNTAYYTCSVCNKYFSDEAGKTQVEENSWVVAKKEYALVIAVHTMAGSKVAWTPEELATFKANIEASIKAQMPEFDLTSIKWNYEDQTTAADFGAAVNAYTDKAHLVIDAKASNGLTIAQDAEGNNLKALMVHLQPAYGSRWAMVLDKENALALSIYNSLTAHTFGDPVKSYANVSNGRLEMVKTCSVCGEKEVTETTEVIGYDAVANCTGMSAGDKTTYTLDKENMTITANTLPTGASQWARFDFTKATKGYKYAYVVVKGDAEGLAIGAKLDADGNPYDKTTDNKQYKALGTNTIVIVWDLEALGIDATKIVKVVFWAYSPSQTTTTGSFQILEGGFYTVHEGHTEVTDDAVNATCTTTGLTEGKHCSVCGEVLVAQEVVEATGHTEVTDQAVNPTCTATGLTEGKHCSVCNEVLVAQEVVEATGHTEVTDEAVNATCTSTGLTQGSHCSVCNEVLVAQEVVEMLDHNYVNGVCDACGASDPNYVPPTTTTEPTTTEPTTTEPTTTTKPQGQNPTGSEPTEGAKKGCKGSIVTLSIISIISLGAVAFVAKKREE